MSKADAKSRKIEAPTQHAISAQLELLTVHDAGELRALWPEHFGCPAPGHMRRDMLARVLAYQVQARAFGDLPKSAMKMLDNAADREFGDNARQEPLRAGLRLTTGTRLVRDWHGITHEVHVTENGFLWRGTTFRSLSGVAREITGTRWNGPAFFGLRSKSNS